MQQRLTVLTGFPNTLLSRRLLSKIVHTEHDTRIVCIVQATYLDQATEFLAELDITERRRIELWTGDASAMDFGLSGREYMQLAASVTTIHHCSAATYPGVERRQAQYTNIGGAREILELAEAADGLERIVYWSTALVSGRRKGYVFEEELIEPPGFHGVVDMTRFRAERLIREASSRYPITILRPSIIVGDSETGEMDRLDGPYLLIVLLLNAASDRRMPLPALGDTPMHLVPVEYVVEAGYAIGSDSRSIGHTYHIVDPRPESARRVFELLAAAAGRPVRRTLVPTQLATAVLRTPGLERFARAPRALLDHAATDVVYDSRNTRALLSHMDLRCPPFESYVQRLVDYVRRQNSATTGPRPTATLRS